MNREAFDLRNPACRENFRRRWRRGGMHADWFPSTRSRFRLIRLALSDTLHRVCPPAAMQGRN